MWQLTPRGSVACLGWLVKCLGLLALAPLPAPYSFALSFIPLGYSNNECLLRRLVQNLGKLLFQFFQFSKYCVPFHWSNRVYTKTLPPLLKQEIEVFILRDALLACHTIVLPPKWERAIVWLALRAPAYEVRLHPLKYIKICLWKGDETGQSCVTICSYKLRYCLLSLKNWIELWHHAVCGMQHLLISRIELVYGSIEKFAIECHMYVVLAPRRNL